MLDGHPCPTIAATSEELSAQSNATGMASLPPDSGFRDSTEEMLQRALLEPASHPLLLGRIDDYEVLRVIGAGGMGIVFLARKCKSSTSPETPQAHEAPHLEGSTAIGLHPPTDSVATTLPIERKNEEPLVAVKVLKAELAADPRAVRYFLREARYMQQLDHPNVVKVLAVSPDPKRPYFVIPYFEQGSLARFLSEGRCLPPPMTLRIASQIASALQEAHARGIVHRDLKPGNILVDGSGKALLTDFGLARSIFNDTLIDVRRAQREGTAPYMSPVSAAGQAEDTRSDIYSFGALLYEMLTGSPPYVGDTKEAIVAKILAGPPAPILERESTAPEALVKVCEGAMARELRFRYAQIADVVDDLDRVAKGFFPLGPHGRGGDPNRGGVKLHGHRRALGLVVSLISLAAVLSWLAWTFSGRNGSEPRHDSRVLGTNATTPHAVGSAGPVLEVIHRVSVPGVWTWQEAIPGNLRGTDEPDVFLASKGEVLVVSPLGEILKTWRVPDPDAANVSLSMVTNVLGRKEDQMLVNWTSGTNLAIAILNNFPMPLQRFNAQGSVTRLPNGFEDRSLIRAQAVVDLRQDGKRDLLAFLGTGFGKSPRGLACFSLEAGEMRWQYLFGPHPIAGVGESSNLACADVDGDGLEEILAGARAVGNDARGPDGTDDNHAYLFAIRHDGRLLFARSLGEAPAGVSPLVLSSKGNKASRIYAVVKWAVHNPEKTNVGIVVHLDAEGHETARYDAGAGVHSCLGGDLDQDGMPEIYLTDTEGRLHVLDADLRLRNLVQVVEKKHDIVYLRLGAVADLDGDHQNELLFSSFQQEWISGKNPGDPAGEENVAYDYDNQVFVLDQELRKIASHLVAPKWAVTTQLNLQVAQGPKGRPCYIYVLARELLVLQLRPPQRYVY